MNEELITFKWGTDSHVQYMEPIYKFPLKIGASGEMTLRLNNGYSEKMQEKITGFGLNPERDKLILPLRTFLMSKVKPHLAQAMQNSEFGIFEIDLYMNKLSEVLHKQLVPEFKDYGISLERFFITTIVKPEGDKTYEKFKQIHFQQFSGIAGIINKFAKDNTGPDINNVPPVLYLKFEMPDKGE